MQIRDGLHIYAQTLDIEAVNHLAIAILRGTRADGQQENMSLLRAISDDLELQDEFDPLSAERGVYWRGKRPDILKTLSETKWRHVGDTVERLDALAAALVKGEIVPDSVGKKTVLVIKSALPKIRAAIALCAEAEEKALLRGLEGKYVAAGPAGAPTRGRPETLPTGRNFYSMDSRALPTPSAWRIGWASATALLDRYLQDEGCWPRALTLSAWGTANMRTGGDDIAQMLALMGVRPLWDHSSRRVTGFEVLPLSVLARPRIDVTLRCSGFFRDAFPAQIQLLDRAVQAVSQLDEPSNMNPLAAHKQQQAEKLRAEGIEDAHAERLAGLRIFSAKPGAYGAGLQTLIDESLWDKRQDFADAFMIWSGYGYGEGHLGKAAPEMFASQLSASDGIIHNQDNREHDLLDSDDYYQFIGGLSASIASLKGKDVPIYHNDHSQPDTPKIRQLGEEVGRVVRGRAANPKWVAGVMRHGYKGAFEIAATLDYLFAFAATTRQVSDHHFSIVYEAWIENSEVADFIKQANPNAWGDMIARFSEAIERGLWNPRKNHIRGELDRLLSDRHPELSEK